MSYKRSIPIVAGADLSGAQYKAIAIGGTIAATGIAAMGFLQNAPENGEDAEVTYDGRSKFVAGAAIAIGARLTITTSGYTITCTSGSASVGRALAAVNSGSIAEGIFNFAAIAEQS